MLEIIQRYKIALGLIFLGLILLALLVPVFIFEATKKYIYYSQDAVPIAQAALILGASVQGRRLLSPILLERTDAAVHLYQTHRVSKILVSGDNGSLSHNEVSPVGKYLLSAGIPQGDIFLDHAGFDTYSSMYRAKYVFDVSSLIIVSQSFHLPRAIFIARALGIPSYGYVADGGMLNNYLREIPANDRALVDVLLSRRSQYVGAQFPITGNGEATWP